MGVNTPLGPRHRLLEGANIGLGDRRRRHGDEAIGQAGLLENSLLGGAAWLAQLLAIGTVVDDGGEVASRKYGERLLARLVGHRQPVVDLHGGHREHPLD